VDWHGHFLFGELGLRARLFGVSEHYEAMRAWRPYKRFVSSLQSACRLPRCSCAGAVGICSGRAHHAQNVREEYVGSVPIRLSLSGKSAAPRSDMRPVVLPEIRGKTPHACKVFQMVVL